MLALPVMGVLFAAGVLVVPSAVVRDADRARGGDGYASAIGGLLSIPGCTEQQILHFDPE